ncbi:phosphate acetyltransferase [Spongorhabdus nitratireducens]
MHTLYIAPTHFGTGLTSASLGLVRALDRLGVRVHYFKPISVPGFDVIRPGSSNEVVQDLTSQQMPDPISMETVEDLLGDNKLDVLLEDIVARFDQASRGADVVVVEGMQPTRGAPYIASLNSEMARALDSRVVLVSCPEEDETLSELADRLEITAEHYGKGGLNSRRILGYIINKLDDASLEQLHSDERFARLPDLSKRKAMPIGYIPWKNELSAPRTSDLAASIKASIMFEGDIDQRRVTSRVLTARTAANMAEMLKPGALIITPGDRDDIILASSMAAQNGVPLAGLLLTGGEAPADSILDLCRPAIQSSGLPVICCNTSSYKTATMLDRLPGHMPADDRERIDRVMETVADHINSDWLHSLIATTAEERLSPPAFRYQLVRKAQQAQKRIVLPEGDEPRTIKAAAICQERGIANCVLLAKREEVEAVAASQGITLPEGLEIIDPETIRKDYVDPMVELRKHKGLNEPMAEAQLEDTVVLGTMMLAEDHVDGLVSGAVHTTANTIRPAFQLIKPKPGSGMVSSVFFMLMPEQVLVYGDCAVNPDPTAEQLAAIAIQSADSAAAFGIEPRVAMLSYSTGSSGQGSDVEKVIEATRIAREQRPDLMIDGPLQYDAASVESVAKSKAPGSDVAGRATVFVFPDLNTGNTTYKAVQRSANVVSVGPMLQGLRKPVNDLSRGALVDDIVFTVALTAIQAEQG